MSVATEVHALRSSAGWSRADHVALVRVEGPDALDFLQGLTTQSPYAREGRVRHTLLLREDATIFADVLVVKAEEAFFVLAEGPDERALIAWLEAARTTQKQVEILGLGAEWAVLGIDGPYAWEVLGGLFGPVVLGMPYLSLLRREDVLCLRAGKTGEYGYLLLVPRASLPGIEARLGEIGGPLDLARVSLEALDVCALESWHFSMRVLGGGHHHRADLTPVELQLQWRIGYMREFIGAEAVRARRATAKFRATCLLAAEPVAAGTRVLLAGIDVGEILATCASPTLGMFVGAALLERRFAHPHVSFTANGVAVRTHTASLVQNLSLRVQPHKNSYATRNAVEAPA